MTKTREQAETILELEMAALKKQQVKVQRLRSMITRMAQKDADNEPMTMARALDVFLNDGHTDYEKGRQHLEMLTWKGAWKGTGLMYSGSYWPGTKQRQLKVALDYNWDKAKLAELEALLLTVLPDMKTGNYDMSRAGFNGDATIGSWDKKVATVDGQTLKIFDIFEHDLSMGGDYMLGIREDGSAVVFDQRRMRHGLIKVGTLTECLEVIRQEYWYQGGPREEGYDD